MISVEVDGIFVTLIMVENLSSWAKSSDSCYVKQMGCHHAIGELEGVSGDFPEVRGCDRHVLAVSRTSSR